MSTIVTRAGKGSPLTHTEVDANFTNLNTDKLEVGAAFNSLTRSQIEAALIAGTNVTITPAGSGATRTLTIAASGGGDSGDVTAAAAFATDNRLIRSDGTGKGVQASAITISDNGEVTLPEVASPATPAAANVNLYGTSIGGSTVPGFLGPDGYVHTVQSDLGEFNVCRYQPTGNAVGAGTSGDTTMRISLIGVASAATTAVTNLHRMTRRLNIGTSPASTSAVGGLRGTDNLWRVGKDANAPGGFLARLLWGPATGTTITTHRGFCGMIPSAAPGDVEPSSLVRMVGMGWDAADTNIQFMHNDGSGTATKVDLGASFPVPTVEFEEVYECQLFSPNNTTQSVSYRIIRYNTTDKTIAAVATGTVTTDLPAVTTLLAPLIHMSVGGTSSVMFVAPMGMMIATAY